jgi:hypothetical protein
MTLIPRLASRRLHSIMLALLPAPSAPLPIPLLRYLTSRTWTSRSSLKIGSTTRESSSGVGRGIDRVRRGWGDKLTRSREADQSRISDEEGGGEEARIALGEEEAGMPSDAGGDGLVGGVLSTGRLMIILVAGAVSRWAELGRLR